MIAIGQALRSAGLTSRALVAWAGTDRLSALGLRAADLAAPRELTPAAAVLVVFVAGGTVPANVLRLDVGTLDALERAELVERSGGDIRARVAVLPLGSALLVCDRADAPRDPDLVCWPDDSSYHLAGALPAGPVARWLDLGCGSAFAALARPRLGTARVGAELNPRAARYAALGATLSEVALEVITSDLDRAIPEAARGTFALVSCNAPIPGDPAVARWRRAEPDFFARLWPAARSLVAPGGTIIVHGFLEGLVELDDGIARHGEHITVAYTPGGLASTTGFGVTWWRPDAPSRTVRVARLLTTERPHLDARDLADASEA